MLLEELNFNSIYVVYLEHLVLLLMDKYFKRLFISLIVLYQKIMPKKLRDECLYQPSCSNYMIRAILKYGCIKGIFLGLKRISRCREPFGGIDYP